jgi:class 3 adenylate cyclase
MQRHEPGVAVRFQAVNSDVMAVVCSSCGTENPETARFCAECATPLAAGPRPSETRRTVTILFADVSGSTGLGEQLDPESMRALMSRYFGEMKRIIERHGGTVEKFIGDAVMAVFGIPTLHEDDALRAVRAAFEIRTRLASLNDELSAQRGITIRFRTGLNTGEVVSGDPSTGQTLVTGDVVNTAARLEQAAQPGEILLGPFTYRMVRDAVQVQPVEPLHLKGKANPLLAFQVVAVDPAAAGHARRLDTPLVGRTRELNRLRQTFEEVVSDRACHLFTLLGAAGVGKSRLVAEFLAGLPADATVLRGRCLPYGEGITYWPLAEALRHLAMIRDEDDRETALGRLRSTFAELDDSDIIARHLAQLMGLNDLAAPKEELFWAARRSLEWLATGAPLVLEFDDLQWAEPILLDLLEHVADLARDAPILLLCPARPELLELRPGWGGGKLNSTAILLEALPPDAADQLLDRLLGGAVLPADLRLRITAAAEGNPLFVEEMVGMLVDEGALRRDGNGWGTTPALAQLAVPPSIHALLAARIDQLASGERRVAERAAVVGRVFETAAVSELSAEGERPQVQLHLTSLVRKELVRPDPGGMTGEAAFRFRHLLIRDAAYAALPKGERAALHEHFATWLEGARGDRLTEYEEIVAYHLEQAHRYLRELGSDDAHAAHLGTRAAEHLLHATERAGFMGEVVRGMASAKRAMAVAPADSNLRAELQLLHAAYNFAASGAASGSAELDEALEVARKVGDPVIAAMAVVAESDRQLQVDFRRLIADGEAAVLHAIPVLEAAGKLVWVDHAWERVSGIKLNTGRAAEAAEAAEMSLPNARALGGGSNALGGIAYCRILGVGRPAEVVEQCLEFLAESLTRVAEGTILSAMAIAHAMLGEFDAARADYSGARVKLDEIGAPLWTATCSMESAFVELLAGDPAKAERQLRSDYGVLEAADDFRLPELAALLVQSLLAQERIDEALEMAEVCQRITEEHDFVPQVRWRGARAKALAKRGALDEAHALAADAVQRAAETDFIDLHANALMDLGEVLDASDRLDESRAARRKALALYDAKGHLVGSANARRLLDTADG